jgi:hypothetical protein
MMKPDMFDQVLAAAQQARASASVSQQICAVAREAIAASRQIVEEANAQVELMMSGPNA